MSVRRVCQVMRRFVPEKWGGTESVVHNVARELTGRGIASPIFCTSILATPGEDDFEGVPIRRFPFSMPWFGLDEAGYRQLCLKGGNPLSLRLFLALLRERRVDLIHTHVQHRLGGMARTAAKLKGIPYVASIHGGYFTMPSVHAEKMTEPFQGKLEWGRAFGALFGSRAVLSGADAIVCVGRDEYEECRAKWPAKRVEYMPNGVRIRHFAGADGALFRRHYGLGDAPFILCCARLDEQKNQALLVRAFARFAAERPDWRLVLLGAIAVESYGKLVEETIAAAGVGDRVTIIPGLSPGDPLLPAAYRAANIFCLPTRHEPFGIVILEAWAAGTPVVATRIGGIPGFTHDGHDILLFANEDENELVDRLARLAADDALAERLRTAGRQEVEQYDWSRIADRMLALYEDLVGQERV